jgi:hypothetical protein
MRSKNKSNKSDISGLISFIAFIFTAIFQLIKFLNQKFQRKDVKPLDNIQPTEFTTIVTRMTEEQEKKEITQRNEIIDKIREEIRDAVKNHEAAVKILMALSRIDGVTSQAERRIVFMFLQRLGEKLTEDRHWPHFNYYHAGEWYRAITPDEMASLCEPLKTMPQGYRIMVVSSAQAIVATGGAPKKSERIALEKIMSILIET